MKSLFLLGAAVVGTLLFLRWQEANIQREEAERARAEAMVHERQAADAARAEAQGDSSRVVTRLPDGKLVEHDRRVTGAQSTGMGGFTRAQPTPEPRTMLDRKAYP